MHFKTKAANIMDAICKVNNDRAIENGSGLSDHQLFIFTPAGMFCGKLQDIDDEGEFKGEYSSVIKMILDEQSKPDPDEQPTTGEIGYFMLTDVQFTPNGSSQKLNIPFTLIFSDQIVGMSFGSLTFPNT